MNKFALFSASRDQFRYFSSLKANVDFPVTLKHYKLLGLPSWTCDLPAEELAKQVEWLLIRKQNSTQGQNKTSLYWKAFVWFNQIKANWLYRQYVAWLKREEASYIGIWNGKKFRQAILVLAAKSLGKNLVFFERGPLPGYSCLDPEGVNAFSSIPKNPDFYRTRKVILNSASETQIKREGDYIFVPFQVVEDSNVYMHSPWIRSMRHLYEVLETCLESNSNLKFVIKPHPACTENYDDLMNKVNQNIVWDTQKSTTELVEKSKAVLTINSTVGVEALMAHKKVIVLGDALYGFEPLVSLATSQNELNDLLEKIDTLQVEHQLIDQFLDYLKTDYAIPEDAMQNPGRDHWRKVEEKLKRILNNQPDLALGLSKE